MQLQDVITERSAVSARIEARVKEHEAAMLVDRTRLAVLKDTERLIVAGLDHDTIERGKQIVFVQGKLFDRNGSLIEKRRALVEEAKADIADGCPKLRAEYFGIKNYEGFGDQRSNHSYGYGPRHGSIVFAIGLNRQLVSEGRDLIPGEVEACLYYLAALAKIEVALNEKVVP